jgi:FtsP/CotA-like multicopper oxidase with cupredoxin domain
MGEETMKMSDRMKDMGGPEGMEDQLGEMGQQLDTMGEQMGAMSNQLEGVAGPMSGAGGQMGGMNMDYNYFTINGKAYPASEPWTVKEGDKVRVRIVNISNLAHPMHLHGQDFKVIAKDGEPIAQANQQWMNTLNVAPGETYDIAFIADNPGNWVFHCHELHHTENNGVEPGGLIQVIKYEGYVGYQGSADPPYYHARLDAQHGPLERTPTAAKCRTWTSYLRGPGPARDSGIIKVDQILTGISPLWI